MIEIMPVEQGLYVKQNVFQPMVYFDAWAWRLFSESQELQSRFISALKLRNGTLTISWFGLAEFSIMKDRRHSYLADRLFEAAFPNVFFLHSDFFKVAKAEAKGTETRVSSPPYADDAFFAAYMQLRLKRGPMGLHQLFQTENICQRLERLLDNIAARIESLRRESWKSEHMQKMIERYRAYPGRHYATGFMLRELLRGFMKDRCLKVTSNQAADLCHAVVSSSYCQYVLLDAHWEGQVNQARKRLLLAGISLPMAQAFSKKRVERFLDDFEKSR
jgi:hypothetical protein